MIIDNINPSFYTTETSSDWHFTLLYSNSSHCDEGANEEHRLKLYGRLKLSKTFSGSRTYNFGDNRNLKESDENEFIRVHDARDDTVHIDQNACLEFVRHININSFESSEDEREAFTSIDIVKKLKFVLDDYAVDMITHNILEIHDRIDKQWNALNEKDKDMFHLTELMNKNR